MAKHGRGYLNYGFSWLVTLILAIIPFTSWILGGITRIMRGHVIAGILQLIPGIFVIFWIIDLVTVILSGDLQFFA